jgi:hypothetical protein
MTNLVSDEDMDHGGGNGKILNIICPKSLAKRSYNHPFATWSLIIAAISISFAATLSTYRTSPDAYAICSEQDKIYTVDANNNRVQCIVVQDAYITDIGSLSEFQQVIFNSPQS